MQMPPRLRLSERLPNSRLRQLLTADDRGAVAIEYALLASMTTVVAIAGFAFFGESARGLWTWIGGELTDALTRN